MHRNCLGQGFQHIPPDITETLAILGEQWPSLEWDHKATGSYGFIAGNCVGGGQLNLSKCQCKFLGTKTSHEYPSLEPVPGCRLVSRNVRHFGEMNMRKEKRKNLGLIKPYLYRDPGNKSHRNCLCQIRLMTHGVVEQEISFWWVKFHLLLLPLSNKETLTSLPVSSDQGPCPWLSLQRSSGLSMWWVKNIRACEDVSTSCLGRNLGKQDRGKLRPFLLNFTFLQEPLRNVLNSENIFNCQDVSLPIPRVWQLAFLVSKAFHSFEINKLGTVTVLFFFLGTHKRY